MVKNIIEITKKAKDSQEYCQKYGQRFCMKYCNVFLHYQCLVYVTNGLEYSQEYSRKFKAWDAEE